MSMTNMEELEKALRLLPEQLAAALRKLPEGELARIQELRLRTGCPVSVFDGSSSRFLSRTGRLHSFPAQGDWTLSRREVEDCFYRLCEFSVHTHQQELSQGFVTTSWGDRAGVCGVMTADQQGQAACREISSLSIRISREVPGAALPLLERVNPAEGILIAGMPGSGKTTLLRDLARSLSMGLAGPCMKVTVVDERHELSAMMEGEPRRDLGCCDILCGLTKAAAITQAVRTLSPQLIVCDEVGSLEEAEQISQGLCCGVAFAASAHCGGRRELLESPIVKRLMATGAFGTVALLGSSARPCTLEALLSKEEYDAQTDGSADGGRQHRPVWMVARGSAASAAGTDGGDGTILGTVCPSVRLSAPDTGGNRGTAGGFGRI